MLPVLSWLLVAADGLEERLSSIPSDVPRPMAPHSRDYAPAPTRLTAPDELGLDCELMPYASLHVVARKQERPTVVVWPGRQSPVPFGHRSSSADGYPGASTMLAHRGTMHRGTDGEAGRDVFVSSSAMSELTR